MRQLKFAAAFAAVFAFGYAGPASAAGPRAGARLLVDCSLTATGMTVTIDAKTKGGGKPAHIDEAGPVFFLVDQKVGNQFNKIVAIGSRLGTTTLPATVHFEFCTATGSVISSDATAIRGRGSLIIPSGSLVTGTCSPKKPPSC